VRRNLTGCGFALVDTPACFDHQLLLRLTRTRTVLHAPDKRWWRYPQLACYAWWLEALLGEALPEESVSLKSLEYRHEPEGYEDRDVDHLHVDGSYIRTVCTLYGPATIFRDRGVNRSVPDGQTLLMTATARARAIGLPCTLHRRPGAGPERAVIVCSFEPCLEQPLASIYREVAETNRQRSKPHEGRGRFSFREEMAWMC
jgi:hypothetical protein